MADHRCSSLSAAQKLENLDYSLAMRLKLEKVFLILVAAIWLLQNAMLSTAALGASGIIPLWFFCNFILPYVINFTIYFDINFFTHDHSLPLTFTITTDHSQATIRSLKTAIGLIVGLPCGCILLALGVYFSCKCYKCLRRNQYARVGGDNVARGEGQNQQQGQQNQDEAGN